MFQHFALILLLITLSLARFDDEITTNNADQNRGDGGEITSLNLLRTHITKLQSILQ